MVDKNVRQGVLCALGAYVFWGVIPVYFKAVESVSPLEILAHRVVWSVVLLFAIIFYARLWGKLLAVLSDSRTIKLLISSSLFVSANWLIFIWAISNNRILETSLGYFINPLVSVFFATIFLGERLRPVQLLAIFIAFCGVLNQLISFGSLPLVAIGLAVSFAFYGLIRKKISIDPIIGLCVETSLLLPVALAYLFWLNSQGEMSFMYSGKINTGLLLLAGIVTAFPLVLFAAAANRLSLTSLGIFQYVAPSISFILAVFIYHEPFGLTQIVTFSLIWIAVCLFCYEAIRFQRSNSAALDRP